MLTENEKKFIQLSHDFLNNQKILHLRLERDHNNNYNESSYFFNNFNSDNTENKTNIKRFIKDLTDYMDGDSDFPPYLRFRNSPMLNLKKGWIKLAFSLNLNPEEMSKVYHAVFQSFDTSEIIKIFQQYSLAIKPKDLLTLLHIDFKPSHLHYNNLISNSAFCAIIPAIQYLIDNKHITKQEMKETLHHLLPFYKSILSDENEHKLYLKPQYKLLTFIQKNFPSDEWVNYEEFYSIYSLKNEKETSSMFEYQEKNITTLTIQHGYIAQKHLNLIVEEDISNMNYLINELFLLPDNANYLHISNIQILNANSSKTDLLISSKDAQIIDIKKFSNLYEKVVEVYSNLKEDYNNPTMEQLKTASQYCIMDLSLSTNSGVTKKPKI